MSIIDRLFVIIKRGILGLNKGLGMGLPKLEAIIDGVQRQTYTIITGSTGSGKTTLALYSYVYKPIIENMHNNKYKVIYFSLEMTAEILLAKILSLHIFDTHGIELSYKQIVSRQDTLSPENFAIVESCIPWLQQFSKHLMIYDKPVNAAGIYAILSKYAEHHGKFEETEKSKIYTPNVADETVSVVIDHLGLITISPGKSKKDEMDLASKYLIRFRNMCSYSPLVLLQLNRTSSSMDRRKAELNEIELSDIKDTGGPSEDAEVVLAIFFPWREKLSMYKDYKIKYLKDRFRAIQILKSRLGEADKSIAINFFGSIGLWQELPAAEEMKTLLEEEYEPYLTIGKKDKQTTLFKPVEAEAKAETNKFKFVL